MDKSIAWKKYLIEILMWAITFCDIRWLQLNWNIE